MKLQLHTSQPEEETLFAQVILPLAVKGAYTYRIPNELREEATTGKRVSVQFGKNKVYAGIVLSISDKPPREYEAKQILEFLDALPLVPEVSLVFWNWMAGYYLCTLGEVMKAAIPAGLRLESETRISLRETLKKTVPGQDLGLSTREQELLDLLKIQNEQSIADLSRKLDMRSVLPTVRSLFDKELVQINEKLDARYKVKTSIHVSLDPFYAEAENLKQLFSELEKTPRQLELLQAWLVLSRRSKAVTKAELLKTSGSSEHVYTALRKKEVFRTHSIPVSRLLSIGSSGMSERENDSENALALSPVQEQVRLQILEIFTAKSVCLLHGVTSSGKTEIYLSLIAPLIKSGRQVLYLLPEIALTTQIINRLKIQFGSKVGLFHSRMNEMERVEVWQKIAAGEYSVVLGARSAIFLPFKALGLVIVDEEHESSFKQYDPAPRYNARDAAIYLASLWKVPALLGSATPSIETYYQTETGKYGRVDLFERYGGVETPEIELIDLRIAVKRKEMYGHFSKPLLDAMVENKEASRQTILFQNRRGYSPVMICRVCAHVERCINCDVSLTYHKKQHTLICHYCGYKTDPVYQCPVCGNLSMDDQGLGTEKIEEEITALIPGSNVVRMDFDTTRTRHAYENILEAMENGSIDFLVGTQMVSRGLDFANVNLTAILAADNMLNFPDFRAFERSFSLLIQVSGRAGRRAERGRVFIQTWYPGHSILQQVKDQNYPAMYAAELKERAAFQYPPYTRLIRIILKHTDHISLGRAAAVFAGYAKPRFGEMLLGPEDALVPRIRNWYIKHMLLKINYSLYSLTDIKKALVEVLATTYRDRSAKGLVVQLDVDPY